MGRGGAARSWLLIASATGSAAALLGWAAGLLQPGALTPQAIVDRQQGSSTPKWPGFRRAHAKGLCVSGVFIASGDLARHSRARLFRAREVTPLSGRFSIGGGNPNAPDLAAAVRSLALQFATSDGEQWRTAMNSPPVLAVKDPASFHEQLQAARPDPSTGKPRPEAMAAFWKVHPEAKDFRAWQARYRPTSSFATERYHSINAFLLENAGNGTAAVRWAAVPTEAPMSAQAIQMPQAPDALQAELVQRLARGPVRFRLEFQFAGEGDDPADPSKEWPTSRPTVAAGEIVLRSAAPQDGGSCDGINFDPLVLPDGIAPSKDPILHARSSAYAESYRRRAREQGERQ